MLETPPPPHRPRPRRSRLLLIGLPLLAVFAAFAAVVWMAYEDGAYGPPVGEPPLIAAAGTPLKLAPGDPGGRAVADQGEVRELMSDQPLPASPERLLPLPEAPLVPPTAAELAEAPDVADPASSANGTLSPTPAPAPLPTATPPVATPSRGEVAEDEGDPFEGEVAGARPEAEAALQALLEQVGQPTAATPRPGAAASTEEPGAASTGQPPAGQEVRPAIAAPAPQPATPAPSRTETPIAAIEPGQPVGGATQGAGRAAPQPAPQATPSAAVDPAQDRYRVQLAAVREEADARRAWDLFMIDLGPVLSRLQPHFERAETANGVFYRVQAGPFATLDSAESVCDELKQRNASCFVVRR